MLRSREQYGFQAQAMLSPESNSNLATLVENPITGIPGCCARAGERPGSYIVNERDEFASPH